jgi:hypothetical protein
MKTTDRGPSVKSAYEEFEMLKKVADITNERDSLSSENKILKEKSHRKRQIYGIIIWSRSDR